MTYIGELSRYQRRPKILSFRDLTLQQRLIVSLLLPHSVTLESKVVLLLVLQFLCVVIRQLTNDRIADVAGFMLR